VLLAIIQAKRQNSHAGGEKYEKMRDSITALFCAGWSIVAGTDAMQSLALSFRRNMAKR
jgi:hypothetical protein